MVITLFLTVISLPQLMISDKYILKLFHSVNTDQILQKEKASNLSLFSYYSVFS